MLPALLHRFHEAKTRGDASVTCLGSGTSLREFLHSDDLGAVCVFALGHWSAIADDAPRNKVSQPLAHLNVGTGVDFKIPALAEQIAAVVGFRGDLLWDTSKADGTPKTSWSQPFAGDGLVSIDPPGRWLAAC